MLYRFRSLASAASRPVLAIVTGAGASNDSIASVADSNYQPPLTSELFAQPEYLRKYLTGRGSAKGLVADITSQLSRHQQADASLSIEEALTREYESSKGNDSLRRGFTAMRFYLRDLFRDATKEWPVQVGGATNYTWLVRNVEKWRSRANGYVLWVTFNYDGLVDQALADFYNSDFGIGGDADPQLAAFLEVQDWALIKLHGTTGDAGHQFLCPAVVV